MSDKQIIIVSSIPTLYLYRRKLLKNTNEIWKYYLKYPIEARWVFDPIKLRERSQRESSDWLKSKISQPALIRVLSFWSLPFTKLFWSKKRENKHSDSNRRFAQDIDLKAREKFERENKREKNSPFDYSMNAKRERENAREKSEGSCYVFSSICFYFYKLPAWLVTGITLRINKWSGLKQIKSMV